MRRQKNLMKKNTVNEFNKLIVKKDKSISNELFKEYFKYQSPSYMYENLNKTKNTERNKIEVN